MWVEGWCIRASGARQRFLARLFIGESQTADCSRSKRTLRTRAYRAHGETGADAHISDRLVTMNTNASVPFKLSASGGVLVSVVNELEFFSFRQLPGAKSQAMCSGGSTLRLQPELRERD